MALGLAAAFQCQPGQCLLSACTSKGLINPFYHTLHWKLGCCSLWSLSGEAALDMISWRLYFDMIPHAQRDTWRWKPPDSRCDCHNLV